MGSTYSRLEPIGIHQCCGPNDQPSLGIQTCSVVWKMLWKTLNMDDDPSWHKLCLYKNIFLQCVFVVTHFFLLYFGAVSSKVIVVTHFFLLYFGAVGSKLIVVTHFFLLYFGTVSFKVITMTNFFL